MTSAAAQPLTAPVAEPHHLDDAGMAPDVWVVHPEVDDLPFDATVVVRFKHNLAVVVFLAGGQTADDIGDCVRSLLTARELDTLRDRGVDVDGAWSWADVPTAARLPESVRGDLRRRLEG